MKKIAVILVILFCFSACGSENVIDDNINKNSNRPPLAERVKAPEKYVNVGNIQSPSGISKINIDAQVVVPDTKVVNTYEAKARKYSDEEITNYFNHIKSGKDWKNIDILKEFTKDQGEDELPYQTYHLWVTDDKFSNDPKGKYASFFVSYGEDKKTGGLAFMQKFAYEYARNVYSGYELIPLVDGKANDCTISLEKAIEIADAEVAKISKEYKLTAYGQAPKSDVNKSLEVYSFVYTKHLNNVPVNFKHNMIGPPGNNGEGYSYIAGQGAIAVLVDDEGILHLSYDNPMDITSVLQEDVELLSFDEIMDIYEKICILSMQSIEIDNPDLHEYRHEVYEIRFGYMTVPIPNKQDSYEYVPVWDFYMYPRFKGVGGYGNATENPSNMGYDVGFTINAINGTVIDRNMGY